MLTWIDRFWLHAPHGISTWFSWSGWSGRTRTNTVKIRAGATSKIRASQGPKWFFPKMPPFSSWHSPRQESIKVVHDLMSFGGCRAIFPYLMLFSAIYFSVRWRNLGQLCEPKLPPIDPTMEVAFVKHDLRNISALGEDGIGAHRLELQCKMHYQNGHILHSL